MDGRTISGDYLDDLPSLTGFLDRELDPHASAWMAGYARVTVNTPSLPLVIASPLFVEYIPAPDQ